MGLTRQCRWLCAALLAPLVMLAVSASSFSALRCTMSGLLLPETCCPTAEGAAPAEQTPASPALQEAGCCERIVISNAKAPAVATDRADASPGPVVFLVASAVAIAPVVQARSAAAATLRPPGRPGPAFLLTHAFLI